MTSAGTGQELAKISQLPIKIHERSCTDVWCGVLFLSINVGLIVLAMISFNNVGYHRASIPSDSDGKVCGFDYAGYASVYFANVNDITKRVCVAECPKKTDPSLKCIPNSKMGCRYSKVKGYEVSFYETELILKTHGSFCVPTDPISREAFMKTTYLADKQLYVKSMDTVMLTIAIGFGVSFFYLLLVQCLPRISNTVILIAGLIVLAGLVIVAFTYPTQKQTFKLIVSLCLAVLFVLLLFSTLCNREGWKANGQFLGQASQFLKDSWKTGFLIVFYLALMVLYMMAIGSEVLCLWSNIPQVFVNTDSLYYTYDNSQGTLYIMCIAVTVQVLWGLMFLKDSFSLWVGWSASVWLAKKNGSTPPTDDESCIGFRLSFLTHFGSIAVSSFLGIILGPFDILLDIFRPYQNKGCWASIYYSFCCCCLRAFQIIRPDTIPFISVYGTSYLKSVRICDQLSRESPITKHNQSSHSSMRQYRISTYLTICGIMTILCMYIKGNVEIWVIAVGFVLCLLSATPFIALHCDSAESIQLIYLFYENAERGLWVKKHGGQEQELQELIKIKNAVHQPNP